MDVLLWILLAIFVLIILVSGDIRCAGGGIVGR